jgi:drug/metabolite transporter (DMT)-like permease
MIFGRKISGHLDYNPIVVTFWGYTIGSFWAGWLVLLLPFVIQDPRIVGLQFFLPASTWLLLVGFAVLATAIPYSLTNFGMKKIDASAASIVLLFDPVSSIILGFIFMGQRVAFWHFIGAFLIILASVIIALEQKPTEKKH